MMKKSLNNWNISRNRSGIVLLVTLVLLVVLSTLGYTLGTRVAAQRHRDQYIIDYSKARYGCDSAVKYALATLEELDPQMISRPNEPDFSDLFALDEVEYQNLLAQWGIELQPAGSYSENTFDDMSDVEDNNDLSDIDDVNNIDPDENVNTDFYDIDSPLIRGPYGPSWPFVTEPVEFEIGTAKVRIEIEDENAKYPLGWALLEDKEHKRAADAGFETFCEMMRLDSDQIDSLREQIATIGEIKTFQVDFKPITRTVRTPIKTTTTARSRTRSTRTPRTRTTRKTIPVSEQLSEQTTHFAKLFHSSLIDIEALAKPIIVTQSRKESALKYMGVWGSRKVNINTAPRHVLEAAFIFGGDEVGIAEGIIQHRQENTFTNIEDLRNALFRYSNSIDKCEKFVTTKSRFFTIKITAISGVAKASTIIAITKDEDKVKRIAVING
jgi:hypothetical protein